MKKIKWNEDAHGNALENKPTEYLLGWAWNEDIANIETISAARNELCLRSGVYDIDDALSEGVWAGIRERFTQEEIDARDGVKPKKSTKELWEEMKKNQRTYSW